MKRLIHPAVFSGPLILLVLLGLSRLSAAEETDPDWSDPPVQAVYKEWQDARSKLHASRKEALAALIQQQVQAAQEQMARARVSGNMTQQAVARAALQIFEQASEAFQKEGTLKLPEQARREVLPLLETVRREIASIEGNLSSGLEAANKDHAARLREILRQQGQAVEDETSAEALLLRLGRAVPAAKTPKPDDASSGTATSPEDAPAAQPPDGTPGEPGVLASNGVAQEWAPLMMIDIKVAALEIVGVPVSGIVSELSTRAIGMGSQQEIALRAQPFHVLESPKGPITFRLMAVPGRAPAEVMTWPSERNGWKLELRCRPQSTGDGTHSVRLEVARSTEGLRALAASAGGATSEDAEADVPKVLVTIVSRPDGATVLVNGRPAMRGGTPLSTPCEVALPATGAEVVLRKYGYLDSRVGRVLPQKGQTLQAMLTTDPNFVERVARVNAMSPGGATGIRLNAGQKVRITVEGTWSSGERGEMVGPEGYPIGRFPHYYVNPALTPRLTTDAPYGALLMRIGATGPWKGVSREMTFPVEETGIVVFEINETAERNLRRDNKGNLVVRIATAP